ncbi:MAG TPA: ATP-binding cassette domain-containing protein, partial [Micromonosporaceae bacterium]|nr:ATP-binding cassette domain-containing protein [Micromonosporaceae bacterium]
VSVCGVDLVGAPERDRAALRARSLGLIEQSHLRSLRPELTVRDNIALQLVLGGMRRDRARRAADDVLGDLGLAALAPRRPQTLSGGEAQRVAVCAAVAHRPTLVLADEPTGDLDRENAEAVHDLLVTVTGTVGAALLLVSHDTQAVRIAHRIVRIRDGRCSEEWRPDDAGRESLVVDDRGWVRLPEAVRRETGMRERLYASVVDGSIFLSNADEGTETGLDVERLDVEGLDVDEGLTIEESVSPAAARAVLVGHDVGRIGQDAVHVGRDVGRVGGASVADAAPIGMETEPANQPIATLTDVTVDRGGRRVLEKRSLQVCPGMLTVVRGRSGSGKTTLLRLLAGLDRPDSGEVIVAGTDLATLDRAGLADLRRAHLAVAGQGAALLESLDVTANLEMARQVRGLAPESPDVAGWIDALGLGPLRNRAVRVLSGGERQRVGLGRVLAVTPTIAIVDEPTSQQDEANAERLVAVLAAAAARGIAVVAATHDPVLVAAADDVLDLS